MKGISKAAVAAVIAVVGLLSACGQGSASNGSGPTKLAVGLSPNTSTLPFYAAVDKGYFKEAGLDIQTQTLQSGSQSTPLLLNGQLQLSFTDVPSVALASEKNLGIKFVAAAQYLASSGPTTDGILVRKDSGIKTPADLQGKTVAVAGLVSATEINLLRAVTKAGGDYAKVKLVELPQSAMVAAVDGGKVDAAALFEPFVSQGTGQGLQLLVHAGEYANPGALITGFAATSKYLGDHANTVKAFTDAYDKGVADVLASIKGDKSYIKQLLSKYTTIPASTVDSMVLPTFIGGPIDPSALRPTVDSMHEYGHLTAKLDASTLVAKF